MTAEYTRYAIRYRFDGAHHALLIQDAAGDAHILTPAGLACRIAGAQRFPSLEPTLRRLGWMPVPEGTLYHLDDLLRLLSPAAA